MSVNRRKESLMYTASNILKISSKYALLIMLSLIIVAPIVSTFLGGIRTTAEFVSQPFGLPTQGIQWENYTSILEDNTFWRSMKNSFIMSGIATTIGVVLSSMLAFVFARLPFFGRGIFFNIFTLGLLFPLVVAILPVFIRVKQLDLINSYWGVILPLVTFGLPGSTIILRGFFRAIPSELEDAAYIDGCTRIGFFRYILIPLARPAIAAVATLQMIASWNEYFLPLLVLNDPKKWPLPLMIMQFQGQYATDWARIMAFVTLLIIPAVIFYLFTERYIVTGLTGGELKG